MSERQEKPEHPKKPREDIKIVLRPKEVSPERREQALKEVGRILLKGLRD